MPLAGDFAIIVPINLMHAALSSACGLVLIRLKDALKSSQFLWYLGLSWIINGVFYLNMIVYYVAEYILEHKAAAAGVGIAPDPTVVLIGQIWSIIDSGLSLASSLCLIAAYYLIRHYPQEDFPVQSAVVVAIIAGVAATFSATQNVPATSSVLLIIDILMVTLSVILVGQALFNLTNKGAPNAFLPAVQIFGRVSFWIWGLLQPLYLIHVICRPPIAGWLEIGIPDSVSEWFSDPYGQYFMLLLIFKVVCAGFAALYSTMVLEPRPATQVVIVSA